MVAFLWALNKIKKIRAPGKSGLKFTKMFYGMLPPKPSHHAKFHQDLSNQLAEKCYLFCPSRRFFCHGRTEM